MRNEETRKNDSRDAGLPAQFLTQLRWIVLGVLTGAVTGLIGTGFYYAVRFATSFRMDHSWTIFLLPLGGLAIAAMYHLAGETEDPGTNLVIHTITGDGSIPLRKAPLVIAATTLTHLFGGSSGREGAALQFGGSIGYNLGLLFRLKEGDRRIITMCGMSAAFAALFGTPLTAAFFAMEMSSVGILYYAALVPCALSALTASALAEYLGAEKEVFYVRVVPELSVKSGISYGLLAILGALAAVLFCIALHTAGRLYGKYLKNRYLRIFTGGVIVMALTLLSGTRMYNGAGMSVINSAVQGNAPPEAFLLKMLFTALTLGAGYKGGEIVPSLYIGATFGCLFSNLFGTLPALSAAIGMGALFCGVTNCPIASLLLCFELFGYLGMPYYLIAIAFSYTFSGYYSLYSAQKIVYSKTENKYINRKAH